MPSLPTSHALLRFILALCVSSSLVVALGCNRLESSSASSAVASTSTAEALAAAEPVSAASRPADSDLTSLGPDSETRVYYQFIDARGSVRFVERLDDVPVAWRDRVGYLELDSPPPLVPADAIRVRDARHARSNPQPVARQAAGGSAMDRFDAPEVLLYYADWCGYCKKAKRHLEARNVEYQLLDVDRPAIKQELVEKTGSRGIPMIEVNGRIMKGYNANRLDQLLDEA